MKNKIYVAYFPVILFLFIFIFDKIFLIKKIQLLTQKDATFLYYQYKPILLQQLKESFDNNKYKNLVIIGSSRLMFVDYKEFKNQYKDWDLFNFSVPVNSPAYYLYIIDKIVKYNIKPDLIILESDPYQFNEYSPGFKKSNLPYTFDLNFVIRNFHLFEREEVSDFLGYVLFAGKRYPPDLAVLWQRLSNPNDKLIQLFYLTDEFQKENRGCGLSPIPLQEWYLRDLSEIEISSLGTKDWLYKNYKESKRQKEFFRLAIQKLKDQRINFIVIKPQLSPIMEEMLQKDTTIQKAYQDWELFLMNLLSNYPFIDFSKSEDFYCNTFVDGSHMSKECYDPMLEKIFEIYKTKYK